MKIDSYSNGRIVIGGHIFKKDLILFPGWIISDLRREKGRSLNLKDLGDVIKVKPEILIIGKGSSGLMKVPSAVNMALKKKGIEVITANTDSAVEIFNEQTQLGRKVAGAFHLTC